MHNEDRFNPPDQSVDDAIAYIAKNPNPDEVYIVITHGQPKGILDRCPQGNVVVREYVASFTQSQFHDALL